MSHERKEIRDAIKTALLAVASPLWSTRVSSSRQPPVVGGELPTVSVYTDTEEVDSKSALSAPRELKRTVQVAIDAWAGVPSNGALDDALDALSLQVEAAMDVDPNLSVGGVPKAFDSVLTATQFGMTTVGDRPLGVVHLEYAVTYHTQLRNIDAVYAALDDFDKAGITYADLDGTAPAIVAAAQTKDLKTDIHE